MSETADPWAAYRQPPAVAATASDDSWAAYREPPGPPKEQRKVGTAEAGVLGARNSVSFGAAPAMMGAAEAAGAGGDPGKTFGAVPIEPEYGAVDMLYGAGRVIKEKLSGVNQGGLKGQVTGDQRGEATKVYDRRRTEELESEKAALDQHPAAYITGQVAGSLVTPTAAGVALKGASGGARILAGAKAGAVSGAAYGAGGALSEEPGWGQAAIDTAKGAGTGAAFGTAGSAALEGGKSVFSVVSRLRGAPNSEKTEAARALMQAYEKDKKKFGPGVTPEEAAVGDIAGTPRVFKDLGQQEVLSLARDAANKSPEAWQTLKTHVDKVYENQAERIGGFIRQKTGAYDAGADMEAIRSAARRENRARYNPAYKAGDRPIQVSEDLLGSPAMLSAIKGAVERGKDRAVLDGYGGFNPGVTVTPDGRLVFNKGPTGVPTYPNVQFWDYVQRELRQEAKVADRSGHTETSSVVNGIRDKLLAQVDKAVPEFKTARQTAAGFFGAQNALEAGQEFVKQSAKIGDARRAIQQMSKGDRALFARGFAADLADQIERTSDRQNIVNKVFNSVAAREKVEVALGPEFTKEFETLLRVETQVDRLRQELGNSTTAKQLLAASANSHSAVGAVGAMEAIKEHGFSPASILASMFGIRAAQKRAHVIDQRVAEHTAALLLSTNPADFTRGINVITTRPHLFNALRQATSGAATVAAHDIGPERAAAGAVSTYQHFRGGHDEHGHGKHDSMLDQMQP